MPSFISSEQNKRNDGRGSRGSSGSAHTRSGKPPDQRSSTNPFDSSDDSSSSGHGSFYECEDEERSGPLGAIKEVGEGMVRVDEYTANERKKRVAALAFDPKGDSFEAPALRFDAEVTASETETAFISPLEEALARGAVSPSSLADDNEEDNGTGEGDGAEELTALLPQHESGGWWSKVACRLSPTATWASAKKYSSNSDSDAMSFHSANSDEPLSSPERDDLFPDIMAEASEGGESIHLHKHDRVLPEVKQQRGGVTGPRPTPRTRGDNSRRTATKKKRKSAVTDLVPLGNEEQIVLKEIGSYATDSEFTLDYHSPGTPWTKVIILEEIGTALSWLILLLPYISFFIALALDSVSSLQDMALGPLSGQKSCVQSTTLEDRYTFPLVPLPQQSCSYPYRIQKHEGLLSYINRNNEVVDKEYRFFMSNGFALTSGPVRNVPAMSTFLYGDVTFTNLSTDAVALVTQGTVLTSTAVFQRKDKTTYFATDESKEVNSTFLQEEESGDDNSRGSHSAAEEEVEWFPVSISKPSRLKMVCTYGKANELWNCTSPRLVDVLFSLPGTAVLTGGDIRVESLFSHHSNVPMPSDIGDRRLAESSVSRGKRKRALKTVSASHVVEHILHNADLSNPDRILSELSTSAAYILEHQRPAYSQLIVITRLISLAVSFCFLAYWVWQMGFDGFSCTARATSQEESDGSPSGPCSGLCGIFVLCSGRQREDGAPILKKKQGAGMWWESPFIIMPERRYVFILLICLLILQNPILGVAYYRPVLYSSVRMHVVADCLIGIGVHGILMLTTCLMQGLRYHTAAFNRKRAKQQRKILELQRTAKYLASEGHPHYGANAPVSSYTASYYDLYGDIDGSGFAGGFNSRLRHDPCGDGWADFLLIKLVLLSIGAASVIVSSVSRFPGPLAVGRKGLSFDVTAATISREVLNLYKTMYVVSSFVQFSVLIIWTMMIGWNVFVTGAKLKKEPFLSTRPAQLAFRVLTSIVLLGLLVVVVPFVSESIVLLRKWTGGSRQSSHGYAAENEVVHNTSSGFFGIEAGPSPLEALVRVVFHATARFPYSGTAASIGPGKILYVTVCSLVAAFIFLPASCINDGDADTAEKKSQAELDREHQRHDKRHVVTLARYTNSWRVFPLPIKREAVLKQQAVPSKILPPDAFQLDVAGRICKPTFDRSIMYKGRYMPVFCLEIACWLLEAAWQAYYSHTEFRTDDWAPGRMSLDSVGLKLQHYIHDETFDTHAFVCSNLGHQVDGEKDSIIVVAFRGTATTKNMRTDLKWQQAPLPEDITGTNGQAAFQIRVGSHKVDNNDTDVEAPPASLLVPRNLDGEIEAFAPKAILKATPIARQTLPCIHEGFLEAYVNIRHEVLEKVLEVFQSQVNKVVKKGWRKIENSQSVEIPTLNIPKIYITGHSLGGALGQILALDLACNCEIVIEQSDVPTVDPQHHEHPEMGNPLITSIAPTRKRGRTQTGDFIQSAELMSAASNGNEGSCETPVLKRRNSFPPRHTNLEERQTSSGSIDFIHAILSGSAFNRRKGNPIRLQPPIAVYTFGQPRVGNHAFARLYKQRVPHTFRVVNEGDAFTSLPKAICCGGLYKHAGLDVVLDEGCTGNTLVGPTVVETMFRFSKMRTNVGAHSMEIYRDNLESALSENELQEYYHGHGGKGPSLADSSGHGSKHNLPEWVTQVKRSSTRDT